MSPSLVLVSVVLIALAGSGFAQTSIPSRALRDIPHEIEAGPEGQDSQWAAELDGVVNAAAILDIKQTLPALVELTESPNPHLRASALLVLYSIAGRQKAGLPENRREMDVSADEAIVPYISRLEPRLMDSEASIRGLSLLIFEALAAVRPAPPELIKAGIAVMLDPQSTHPLPQTTNGSPEQGAHSIGAQMLWVLLPAGATFHVDPATNITEGRDSAEVQEAIITFLQRPDQTSESLSESIRALAVAQPQNPAVNAHLLRVLDSPDITVQEALLQHIANLTLSPEDFATARARITLMTTDPAKPIELQRIAKSILPCWSNDRHKVCPVPDY